VVLQNNNCKCGIKIFFFVKNVLFACVTRDEMETFFQLQHAEINKNVLKTIKDASAVLKLRVTHIMDCEAYVWHGKFFLREVSVLCRSTHMTMTYHIYMPNVTLFDENDRGVQYQIRLIHGLPVERHRINNNFYLYHEMIHRLRELFKTDALVAYKGGTIERDLLNMLGVSCINMEIMGCPKYECLLSAYNVKHEDCGHHITRGKYHCSRHEVKLFSQFIDRL
jgi:hypothetical protein